MGRCSTAFVSGLFNIIKLTNDERTNRRPNDTTRLQEAWYCSCRFTIAYAKDTHRHWIYWILDRCDSLLHHPHHLSIVGTGSLRRARQRDHAVYPRNFHLKRPETRRIRNG